MKLLTKDLLKKLPPIGSTSNKPADAVKVIVKFFDPQGGTSWYGVEFDPEDNLFFGFANLVDDHCAELGYFSLDELSEYKGRLGLGIERDKFWNSNTTLSQVINFEVR